MIEQTGDLRLPMPLTELRARLFRVAESLLSGEVRVVALSHKGHEENLVLLRAATLAALEDELATLRRRSAPEPRPLRGLGRLNRPAEDVIADIRARERTHAIAKQRDMVVDQSPIDGTVRRAVAERAPRPGRSRSTGRGRRSP